MQSQLGARFLLPALLCLSTLVSIGMGESSKTISHSGQNTAWWVFFDRRDSSAVTEKVILTSLDPKSIERRIRAQGTAVRSSDFPPNPVDLQQLRDAGYKIRTVSTFLNAASIERLNQSSGVEISEIANLNHVRSIRPVAKYSRVDDRVELPAEGTDEIDTAEYGTSWVQNAIIQADLLHDRGFTGQGVRVGFLDSGYIRYDEHVAFDSLQVVGTWNAVDSTENVDTGTHGTKCLSIMCGYQYGYMVGIAPDVEVLLVRTEVSEEEVPAEEDYWVAGLEWAEAHGADLISTSLGYSDWYTYEDFDGNTCVTTIAADAAAARGLLVVTSAGNRGWDGVSAPADGDSVLAIGAVNPEGEIASFSSRGPTPDGRIKPDVCGLGQFVVVARDSSGGYLQGSGTSYSCPAVAGGIACLLQANPALLPMEIIELVRSTATQAENPDNNYGWGIAQFNEALEIILQKTVEHDSDILLPQAELRVYPSPTNGAVRIELTKRLTSLAEVSLFDVLGRKVIHFYTPALMGSTSLYVPLNGISTGTYFIEVKTEQLRRIARLSLVR